MKKEERRKKERRNRIRFHKMDEINRGDTNEITHTEKRNCKTPREWELGFSSLVERKKEINKYIEMISLLTMREYMNFSYLVQ